jgi:hypothetical protein
VSLTRARQTLQLAPPTWRASSYTPLVAASAIAAGFVWLETPGAFVDYRILVLRLSGLLICLGAAFVLDDPTEDFLGYVPTPLLFRRIVRIALAAPIAGAAWVVCLNLAGDVPNRLGGPLPAAALTLEACTALVLTMTAASFGSLRASDRLGGALAAPILVALIGVAMTLRGSYQLVAGSPADPQWLPAHDRWGRVLVAACAAFVYWNQDRGRLPISRRVRTFTARRGIAARPLDHAGSASGD